MKNLKRALSLLLSLMLVLGAVAVGGITASAEATASWDYSSRTLTVSGSGYVTRQIVEAAVPDMALIKRVVLGEGIESIIDSAFEGCTSLSKIIIPSGVTEIRSYAFYGCSSLSEVEFETPSQLNEIGNGAFSNCSSLEKIDIPSNLTSIGDNAFSNCRSLEKINIPSSVTSIRPYAFSGCSSLSEVEFEDQSNLTSIGNSAFSYCDFEEIYIPSGVTEIKSNVFESCRSLKKIYIPSNVTEIGSQAFSFCSSLTDVILPPSVTFVGPDCFRDCDLLEAVFACESLVMSDAAIQSEADIWRYRVEADSTDGKTHVEISSRDSGHNSGAAVLYCDAMGEVYHIESVDVEGVALYHAYSCPESLVKITSYSELMSFAARVNNGETGLSAKLMNDIDASASDPEAEGYDSSNDWTPIGYCKYDEAGKIIFDAAFIGTFDGDGHVITGLICNDSSADYAGLFGYVDSKAEGVVTITGTVKNAGLEGGSITGGNYAGGLVAYNNGGTVTNCYNTGNVSGNGKVGGLVGYNDGGTVQNCYYTGDVSGNENVGGVIGYTNGGTVQNCYNTGAVSGNGNVGGVVGYYDKGKVNNCYFDSSVSTGIPAIGSGIVSDEDVRDVKGLTTAQMTGRNVISYTSEDIDVYPMYFICSTETERPWITKADGAGDGGEHYWFYPHLKGFNHKADGTPETDTSKILSSDWPAKAEITVSLSEYSFEYDGTPKTPTVTSVKVGDKTLDADDYTVSYYEADTEIDSPVNSGDYKAAVSFTNTGYAKGHTPIKKEFKITHISVTLTANSAEEAYDGTVKTVTGFTSSVSGLTFEDTVTASGSGTEVGTYDVTFTGVTINETKDTSGNYVVTEIVNGTLTVNPVITFVNENGTELQSGAVAYGETPEYKGETPVKTENDGYSYEFAAWTPEIKEATENATYTATYTKTENEYTVTYVVDGNETKVTYKYGSPVAKPADPVKDGFNFTGWDEEIPATMPAENLTITAEFEIIPTEPTPTEPTPTEPTPTEPTPTEPTPTEPTPTEPTPTEPTPTEPTPMEPTPTEPTPTVPTPTEPTPTEPTPTEPTPTEAEPAHEHDYKGEVTTEPTCTEDGIMTYTCECGESYTQVIPKTGHKPGEWTVVTPATTEAAGKEVRKCTVCGEVLAEREIAKLEPQETDAGIVSVNLEKTNAFGIANAFGVDPEKLPAGSTVTWYVNGEKAGEGNGFRVEYPTEDYTIKAVVTNRDGKVIGETEEVTVKVNNSFFARIYYWLCRIIQKVIDLFKK